MNTDKDSSTAQWKGANAGSGALTVLMPTLNDWASIARILPEIDAEIARLGYAGRVVVIDDGSSEKADVAAFAKLPLQAIDRMDIVDLFRNQVNQRAIAIGVAYCHQSNPGDYLVVMDSDGQDLPRYIPELIKTCRERNDRSIVFAERTERSEGRLFRFLYAVYQKLYKVLTGLPISIGNYSAVPRPLVRRVANIAELWSHYPASIMRAKLPISTIPSFRGARLLGENRTNWVSHIVHALSGFSVHAEIVGVRALGISALLCVFVVSLIALAVMLKLFTGVTLLGWTSQVIGILLVLLFQIATTTVVMVFMMVTLRMQVPMIPVAEFDKFIADVQTFEFGKKV